MICKILDGPASRDLAATFVARTAASVVLPSYSGACNLSHEILVLAPCDFQVLVEALRPCPELVRMFGAFEMAVENYATERFRPFSVHFFDTEKSSPIEYPRFFDRIRGDIEFRINPVFEISYREKAAIRSDGLARYCLVKKFIELRELVDDQELAFTFRHQLSLAEDLRKTLFRLL